MTLFKKNSGRLGNKYPQVLFLIRCALNEKVLHFPDHYSVTLDVKKYINSIYHVSKGYYNYITDPSMIKLYSELQRDYYSIGSYNLKNSPVCSELFRHVGNLISVTRAYINKKADYPEKKFVLLLLYVFESIRGYSGVQFTKYSLLCKTDVQKIKCYHVGSIIGDKGSSYNLLVLEYQKLGLFKKKEKQEITDKMLKMADSLLSYYPAFKWLEKHKVKHNLKKYFSDKDKEQYKNIGLIDFE